MGRRIDEKNPVVGTRKDDDGSNGMFYTEKQCTKKPLPGMKVCGVCHKKEEAAKTSDKTDKTWYGRLDQPLYANAKVVGCAHFFEKYPSGLKNDPSTAPPAGAPAPKAKKAAKEPKAPKETKETKEAKEAVADTSAAPKTVEWITFLHEGKPYVRNSQNNNVYEYDMSKPTREESTVSDRFRGTWVNDSIDQFGEEAD